MILYISLQTAKKEKGRCFFTFLPNARYHLFLPELMTKGFFPMSFSLQEAIAQFFLLFLFFFPQLRLRMEMIEQPQN